MALQRIQLESNQAQRLQGAVGPTCLGGSDVGVDITSCVSYGIY